MIDKIDKDNDKLSNDDRFFFPSHLAKSIGNIRAFFHHVSQLSSHV